MKYAVVTGSTKGIGKAIAEKLLHKGWFVFVNYASDKEGAQQFVKDQFSGDPRWGGVNGSDRLFEIIRADLSTFEETHYFVEQVRKRTDRIDALILNAATTDRTPFKEITPEKWEKVINTNLNCPFYLAQEFYSNMVEKKRTDHFYRFNLWSISTRNVACIWGI